MAQADLYRYRFGGVVFDEARFQLVVDGQIPDIQRKPLQVLALLLRNAGKVVGRDDFQQQIWQGAPTVDNVLANAVAKLRGALGPAYADAIENLPRVGYRFTYLVERSLAGDSKPQSLGLKAGARVPRREDFVLVKPLDSSPAHEVWLARHAKTSEQRVFKFAGGEGQLAGLRREVTLSRLLNSAVGQRPDFIDILHWNFEEPPYFIESHYGGENLAQWAQDNGRLARMTLADRLALFCQIAAAVAAAHEHGVLHKDLKPTNVLVSAAAGGWQCSVADFGSGRLMDLARLGELGITPLGLTVSDSVKSDTARGSLFYAAPELLRDEPATVRSDIFALGVMLYQMAVADFSRALDMGWERDVDDELLRADIAQATDREPDRRFASVEALRRQLQTLAQRHAELEAQRNAQAHQLAQRQEVARHRARRPWLYATIAALTAGLGVGAVLFLRLAEARQQAVEQLATAQALNAFVTDDLIASADPSVKGRTNVTVGEALDAAAQAIDQKLAEASPSARAEVHLAMQANYLNLTRFDSALTEGERALVALKTTGRQFARQKLRAQLGNAYVLAVLGRLDDAEQMLSAAQTTMQSMDTPAAHEQANFWYIRGGVDSLRFRLEDARTAYANAWAIANAPGFDKPDLAERTELALSDLNKMTDRPKVGEVLARDLMARQAQRWGDQNPRTCFTRVALANALAYQDRLDEASTLAESATSCLAKSLGEMNQRTLNARQSLATVYLQSKRYSLAAEAYAALVKPYLEVEGPASLGALDAASNQAHALYLSGKRAEAEAILDDLLERRPPTSRLDHPQYQLIRYQAARCRLDRATSRGVAELLDGLDAQALNQADTEPDWPERLAQERKRLAALANRKSTPADARPLQRT